MSKVWKFKGLLQESGWITPCFLRTSKTGVIEKMSGSEIRGSSPTEDVAGYVMPGFQNAHSHSFQYAMSGLAEIHSDPTSDDDFWSWREAMYNIALTMSPEQFEYIATMLYSEMLANGYTHVAEFHYVHHNINGKPYANLAEMGERLVAAASHVGIGITLIPIFYQKGGFGKEPVDKQRRFISSTADDYLSLLAASQQACNAYEKANFGIGIHSLRAVDSASIHQALNEADKLPVHIHISEQLKEIEDCKEFYGQRPVEWLLNNFDVNPNFHLVHATHIDEKETSGIAQSGAHVVLCPSTEGNLGDGIFPLKPFQNQNGKWSIGTDSHIGLNPLEELRILDYGQRVTTHKRNQYISTTNGDTGHFATDMILKSGRNAMGNHNEDYFKIGEQFDAIVLDAEVPLIASSHPKNILSTVVFSGDKSTLMGTIVDGDWKVKNGKHRHQSEIVKKFVKSVKEMRIR